MKVGEGVSDLDVLFDDEKVSPFGVGCWILTLACWAKVVQCLEIEGQQ